MHLFLVKSALFVDPLQTARRSIVENDRPPSFHGAPDWWECARFQELCVARSEFR